ncbi:MAG TPA: hypothetical protein VHE35_30260 [Kofleriaceae bacterium]|nr:hypothetical protein [Kofleriaceae bacterium]
MVEPGTLTASPTEDATVDDAPAPLQLLPRSGIGVDGTDLVIAPRGNPVIRLDARLLDRVELIGRSPVGAAVTSGAAAVGAVAGGLALVPGGVITALALGYLAYERGAEARRRARSRDLLLALGDLEVALHVVDGPDAAKRIADRLAPYTRGAPISRPEVYEDAKRRLAAGAAGDGGRVARRELARALAVGDDTVHVVGGFLQIGTIGFRLEEVREAALRGANLALPGGRFVQAALGLLVVAADERARQGEDLTALSRRIGAYEAWSGRTAGR